MKSRKLIQTGVLSLIIRFLSVLIKLAVSILLARLLGPDEFGIYSFVFAIISITILPAQVGLPTLVVRETASAYSGGLWSSLKGFWQWASRLAIIASLLLCSLGFLLVICFKDLIAPGIYRILIVGLFLIPFIALGNLRGAALRGLQHVVIGQLPESIIKPLMMIILVVILLQFSNIQFTAVSVMVLHVIAAIISFVVGALFLVSLSPGEIAHCEATRYSPDWRLSVIPLVIISGMQLVNQYADLIMLGLFRTPAEVGIYKVAVSAATLVVFGLTTVNLVIAPYVARLYAEKNMPGLQRLVAAGSVVSVMITLPIVLVIFNWGDLILTWIYGHEYREGGNLLIILALGQLFNAIFGSVGTLLNMTGHERYTARWLIFSSAVNFILNLLFIPVYGAKGAAWATVISLVIWNLGFWRTAIKKLGIDTSVFFFMKRTAYE